MLRFMSDDRQLIGDTIRDLTDAAERILAEIESLKSRLSELQDRRSQWENRLARLDVPSKTSTEGTRPRARKGENLRRIVALLGSAGTHGLTVAEISQRTGIPWGSVRNEVARKKNGFSESDGRWSFVRSRDESEPPSQGNGLSKQSTSSHG